MSPEEKLAQQVRSEDENAGAEGAIAPDTATFTIDQIATAFEVAPDRVQRAIAGELHLRSDHHVTSKQAQQLAEVLLGDQPLDEREAAVSRLGAFSPRYDDAWGKGDNPDDEPGERLSDRTGAPDGNATSPRSSHGPATNPAKPS